MVINIQIIVCSSYKIQFGSQLAKDGKGNMCGLLKM